MVSRRAGTAHFHLINRCIEILSRSGLSRSGQPEEGIQSSAATARLSKLAIDRYDGYEAVTIPGK